MIHRRAFSIFLAAGAAISLLGIKCARAAVSVRNIVLARARSGFFFCFACKGSESSRESF